MGLFKKSKATDDVPDNLVPNVALAFGAQGFPMDEATKIAIQVVEEARRESRAAGGGRGPGYGDEIIRRAQASDPDVLPTYKGMRSEGVTDDDIRWYWNMSDIEKRVLEKVMDQVRMAHFIHAMDEVATANPKLGQDEWGKLAGQRVRRFHPSFGDPADTTHASGQDRPLYPELKDRIDRYIEKNFGALKELHARLEDYSSFNAFVREEMEAGRL